jgi:hypothetical protein
VSIIHGFFGEIFEATSKDVEEQKTECLMSKEK